jgi:hypothetical protein
MSLTFPTLPPLPFYPTRPVEGDDEATTAFLAALRDFFQHLFQQHATTRRYFDAAGFYCNDANRDSAVRTESQDLSHEAISAVIKNIVPVTKRDYVWDSAQQCWVIRTIQIK